MNKRITNRNNLLLKVFVIGYSERGESVIVLFTDKGDNKLLYSLVIDSFKYKGEHKTVTILDDYGIKKTKLDMLVWSHPDIDHSFGMIDLLNEYCSDKTRVVLPYDLNGKAWNKVNYNKEDEKIINTILDLTRHKFTSHDTATSSDLLYHPLIEFRVSDDIGSLPVSIMALSPHSTRINYALEANKTIEKNDLSITIMISVGYDNVNKFLFCADTENDDIDMLYPEAFVAPHFVKIPHHGSSTSNHLPGKLQIEGENLPVACSTIYKTKGLPEKGVLEQYVTLFKQVDCTGRSDSETLNYGYIQYDFDLFGTQTVEIRHFGHASLVNEEYLNNLDVLIPQKKTSKK